MQELISQADGLGHALEVGAAIGDAKEVGLGSYAVVPQGYELRSLEEFEASPMRKSGTVTLEDAASFIRYFNLHAIESSQIYGRINPPMFVGVLDDHGGDYPGWKDHLVKYACPFSIEWKEWSSKDKTGMSQEQFAEFIERNLPDIVEPPGADMLEISRSLQAKKKVNFSSGLRLANGQQELTYEEEIQGTSAKGKLQIPETFKIGIQVLEGGAPYAIECRLRYRIKDATLVMWYELVRPHKILEDAVNDVWSTIEQQTTRLIYRGSI